MKEYKNTNVTRESLLVYAVTDRSWTGKMTMEEQIQAVLDGGATFLQLREKELSYEDFLAEAKRVKEICAAKGVPFVINDNVKLAIACDADGVHLGPSDMTPAEARKLLGPDKIIGATARSIEQAVEAEKQGADYIGSGAVFGTSTKKDATAMDLSYFSEICQSVSIPIVAIGGINRSNIEKLMGCGMDGFAIVSGLFAAEDPRAAAEDLVKVAKTLIG